MKNIHKILLGLAVASIPAAASAQSAIDALQLSQSDFKGTARFMSMGGAFTALGGDLSTLSQNPAGVGIYRSSEIGGTLDIDFQSTTTSPAYIYSPNSNSQTKAYCNNVGYAGSVPLSGSMRTFCWGISYARAVSFDRVYRGGMASTETSLTNYIASISNGIPDTGMDFTTGYNPYANSSYDWLSILAYNSYLINPTGPDSYRGLHRPGSAGDAIFSVREQGYVDEYNITFGGNVENVVYWGAGIGVTDLQYNRFLYYSESIGDALIQNFTTGSGLTEGSANFDLTTPKYVTGNGWNLKFGLILKPVNELRIGLAVHTPTWYHLTQGYWGEVYADYTPTLNGVANGPTKEVNEYTDDANFNWHLNAPWRFMGGIAAVIGGRVILSADYQYDAYNNMRAATPVWYGSWDNGFESNDEINQSIKDSYQGSNTVRLGLEVRVTPQFSLRAGYNYQTSNIKAALENGMIEASTSGTDCSYNLDKDTYHITAGLGYRYKAWYFDMAYVYKHRNSTMHAYTNFDGNRAPAWDLTDTNSQLVLSTGFKF